MKRNFRIAAMLETSDHGGYCSGEECEYDAIQGDYEVQIRAEDIPAAAAEGQQHLAAFERFLPTPMIGNDSAQSHWCDISCRCTKAGLGKHEYRFTVLSATELLPTDGLLFRDVPLGDKEGTLLRVKHCGGGGEVASGMLRLYFVNRAQTAEVPIPPGIQVLCDGGEALQPTTDQQQSFMLEYPDRYTVTFEGKELIALSHKWHFRCCLGDNAAKK